MSDVISQSVIREKLEVRSKKDVISLVMLVDLLVITPSIILFLAFNIKILSNFPLPFLVVLLAFLLYLPLAIMSAGVFLSRKSDAVDQGKKNENVLPMILFLLLIFSMLGVYIPSVERLAELIPAFGSLSLISSMTVIINLTFIAKSVSKIFGL